MLNKPSSLILLLFLSFGLFGCVPSTKPPKIDYYLPSKSYRGPIEVVAIVMQPPSNIDIAKFHNFTYQYSTNAFFKHPYRKRRFDLSERRLTEQLLREQNLIGRGYIDNSMVPRLGKLLGANYILFVDLTWVSAKPDVLGVAIPGIAIGAAGHRVNGVQIQKVKEDLAVSKQL